MNRRLVSRLSGAAAAAPVAGVAIVVGLLAGAPVVLSPSIATAQTAPRQRPKTKGRTFKLKIDSSPQQAVVYWDSASTPTPKDYGVAGYTPLTLTVPKGNVRVILELKGFRTQERDIVMTKAQTVLVTMERAPQVARLEIVAAGDGSATGGDVAIDGVARGTLPNAFEVAAGRHNIEVKKVGWKPQTRWVEVGEDEKRTIEILLERAEAPTGTLLVTADAPGDVYVDGVRRDMAPAVIAGLSPGEHLIEVRRDGAPPWRQSVTVVSGQQAKVNANVGGGSAGAGLRIFSSEPNVEVFVDGEAKGKAPVTVADIKLGQHLIEGRKSNFKPFEQTVEIVPGKQTLVQLKMEPGSDDRGKSILKVQSTIPDAEVFLDGSTLGKAPIDRHDLQAGKHYVIIRKEGYEEFKREVYLFEGQPVSLVADLRAVGKLRFLSNPQGAEVSVDGEPIGRTPVERDDVAAGDHVFTFKLNGYYDHKETITVIGGKERLVSVDLKALPSGPTAEQVQKRKTGMSSFGARVLPVGGFTADLGLGYPYIFMARLTVGAFNLKPSGLDLGVEFQTFFQMNTLALHSRFQLMETGPLAVGVRGDVGGGAGSSGRNSFFFDLSAIASLDFAGVVSFSADARFSFWSDQFCPSVEQMNNGVTPQEYCSMYSDRMRFPEFKSEDPAGKRFSDSRFYAGFTVVAAVDRRLSVFARLDFLPLAGILRFPGPRMAYVDRYNSVMFEHDPLYYGNAGLSLKF
ncbi:MAG: PEGA domain-containing protein [Bacteroidota bacterium]